MLTFKIELVGFRCNSLQRPTIESEMSLPAVMPHDLNFKRPPLQYRLDAPGAALRLYLVEVDLPAAWQGHMDWTDVAARREDVKHARGFEAASVASVVRPWSEQSVQV